MIVLVSGQNVNITIKDTDMFDGNKKFWVFANNGYYDPQNEFRPCFDGVEDRKKLYSKHVEEYNKLLPQAEEMYVRVKSMYEKKIESKVKNIPEKPKQPSGLGLGMLEEALLKIIDDKIKQTSQSSEDVVATAKPVIEKFIKETYGVLPQVHEIKTPTKTKIIKGIVHEKFDTVLNLINADIPVFLTGAAGTGKNVICKQVAESLGLEFYFSNAVTQEYKITGFIDANGKYHETQFYQAFTKGGLFMLDEMDGSIPEVLIMLNASIANKYFDFPTGRVEAHKDFRLIAAGNTFGTGADIEYTGRSQLDAASLDRFALVEIDYSEAVENAIAQNDSELVEYVRGFRKAVNKAGIKHLATYRSIERMKKLDGIIELREAIKMALVKNLCVDDMKIIIGEMRKEVDTNNRYFVETKKMYAC